MAENLPLSGLKVVEFEGDKASIFCGLYLKDFGADVIQVCPVETREELGLTQSEGYEPKYSHKTYVNRGKVAVQMSYEFDEDKRALNQLLRLADVIIDPYPANIIEKLKINYDELKKYNNKLIIVKITAFGDQKAANEMNSNLEIAAKSGLLSTIPFAQERGKSAPINSITDQIAGGLFGLVGLMLLLLNREKLTNGGVVTVSRAQSILYMLSFVHQMRSLGALQPLEPDKNLNKKGRGMTDSGIPFYDNYRCKDGGILTVGCLEPKFYIKFIKGLGLPQSTYEKFVHSQWSPEIYPEMEEAFKSTLMQKTRDEWMKIFTPLDCCVMPLLNFKELGRDPHAIARGSVQRQIPSRIKFNPNKPPTELKSDYQIMRAPKLSEVPIQKVERTNSQKKLLRQALNPMPKL